MKFRILHLFAFISGFSAVFAVWNWSIVAAVIASVVIFGSTIAHAHSPTISACVAGTLSAAFWVFLTAIVMTVLIFRLDVALLGTSYATSFIVASIIASIVGGYVGARVSLH